MTHKMTKKQFKEALLRGRGRCMNAILDAPEKYYTVVLWACSHEVAFDAQCEGSRSWFVYQLISCYQEKTAFLEAAITGLKNTKSDGGWKMLYLAELLSYFAEEGEELAKEAMWSKYEELYAALMARKRLKAGVFAERDDFAMLCQVLAGEKDSLLKIAEDIGRLYRERPFYDAFDWLYDVKARRYIKTLKKRAQKSKNIAEYLRVEQEYEKAWQGRIEKPGENRPKKGVALSLWLKYKADEETVLKYARTYLEQSDFKERAKALEAFFVCPFPENPLPIIEDTKSECESLKEAAWRALENIRHPLVRKFAVENIQMEVETVLPIFIMNYEEQDEEMLVSLVKSIKVNRNTETGWHGIFRNVLEIKKWGMKVPASLLYYMYENTYCSCCREHILRQMGKQRLLTNEILKECLFDCNDEVRSYAKRCLKRRNIM